MELSTFECLKGKIMKLFFFCVASLIAAWLYWNYFVVLHQNVPLKCHFWWREIQSFFVTGRLIIGDESMFGWFDWLERFLESIGLQNCYNLYDLAQLLSAGHQKWCTVCDCWQFDHKTVCNVRFWTFFTKILNIPGETILSTQNMTHKR